MNLLPLFLLLLIVHQAVGDNHAAKSSTGFMKRPTSKLKTPEVLREIKLEAAQVNNFACPDQEGNLAGSVGKVFPLLRTWTREEKPIDLPPFEDPESFKGTDAYDKLVRNGKFIIRNISPYDFKDDVNTGGVAVFHRSSPKPKFVLPGVRVNNPIGNEEFLAVSPLIKSNDDKNKWVPKGLKLVHLETGKITAEIPTADPDFETVRISPDGETVAFTNAKGELVVYSVRAKKELYRKNLFKGAASSVLGFSPDGKTLLLSKWSDDNASIGALLLPDRGPINLITVTRNALAPGEGPDRFEDPLPVAPPTISPDGRYALLNFGPKVRVVDLLRGTLVAAWMPHEGSVPEETFFCSDGRTLVTRGRDTIKVWRLPQPPPINRSFDSVLNDLTSDNEDVSGRAALIILRESELSMKARQELNSERAKAQAVAPMTDQVTRLLGRLSIPSPDVRGSAHKTLLGLIELATQSELETAIKPRITGQKIDEHDPLAGEIHYRKKAFLEAIRKREEGRPATSVAGRLRQLLEH